ncbi:MAG: bifunctional DNA-formamidopyrimidine glycosylase/DNA-(apurinic or apyrimidinic site) lyase [Clostridiales bacterium]|nr:bifunctional DNA-formamidopyrimidine glycosylase/DNA-(apurinic or apyrimidinic site) lyase [Clostridiales bacterium]
MPELPEVETVKNVIEPQIRGRIIEKAEVRRKEVVAYPDADTFCRRLEGQTISHMTRRGKFLTIWLNSSDRIILHLRMTGCLLLTPPDYPEEKHTHIVLRLNSDMELRFFDTRRFGRFWFIESGGTDTYSGVEKLGLEPFDEKLTPEYLLAGCGKSRRAIKECLLDQNIVAGIGNIYSDEILFTAGIYPARPANSLKNAEWERLASIIPQSLAYFIEKNQIAPEEYLQTKGQDYRNTPFLQVYGRSGKPCLKCGETLCHTVVGGRGSVYCPKCQKE